MRLLLIRHGQTPSNVEGSLDTAQPGATLTPLGERQATALPSALEHELIEAIYASRRTRAQQTASPLAEDRGLALGIVDGVHEISAGDYEMATDADAIRAYIDTVAAWFDGDLDVALPGGESGHDFLDRFDTALRGLAGAHEPAATVALISHGAAIRAYAGLRAPVAGIEVGSRWLLNTGMVVLEGDPDSGWVERSWFSEPLGGADLEDQAAHDVTGEADLD